jgi:heme exporter protein B
MFWKHIWTLLRKDLTIEWRQQHTFFGILLYATSTCFVIYLTQGRPEEITWNALFWIVQLFVCVNAVAKSFMQDSPARMLYYFTVADPVTYVSAKLCYNLVLMIVLTLLTLVLFCVFLGNPVFDLTKYALVSFLGGSGLSLVFTFLAAIAARARQQGVLMAIMGFPIILPQLILLNKAVTSALFPVFQESFLLLIALLVALDILVVALALILFPFLWKE